MINFVNYKGIKQLITCKVRGGGIWLKL